MSAASLLTDLEHRRAQNRTLRAERDALQRSLGHQADQLANAPLVERINELTALAQQAVKHKHAAALTWHRNSTATSLAERASPRIEHGLHYRELVRFPVSRSRR